jgi:hypothetical protein
VKVLLNAFSLQMLDTFPANVSFYEVDRLPSDLVSFIGHKDLADLLGVNMNRLAFKIEEGDEVYVAQYVGGRLPEGTTDVPNLSIKDVKFIRVRVEYGLGIVSNEGEEYTYH